MTNKPTSENTVTYLVRAIAVCVCYVCACVSVSSAWAQARLLVFLGSLRFVLVVISVESLRETLAVSLASPWDFVCFHALRESK